jgi:hypothetical protein
MSGRFNFWLTAAAALVAVTAPPARAVDILWNAGVSNYNTAANWTGGNVPSSGFDERAVINNGGTAFLTNAAAANPVAVALGLAASTSGTLELRSDGLGGGGSLTTDAGGTTSGLDVGVAGTGTLRVERGGSLVVNGVLASANNAANLIVLGAGSVGTANVNVTSASFGGTTQVHRNTSFTANSGAITLSGTSVYTPVIENIGAGAAMLTTTGGVTLGGVLKPSLNFTPANGTTWSLMQGTTVAGAFASIDSTTANLGPGQRLAVQSPITAPGVQQVQLRVEQVLSLRINRNTGEVFINNPGAAALNFDSYVIQSPSGQLNRAVWNSLDDQNALGGDWVESTASNNTRLIEHKPTSAGTLAGGTMRSLGLVFAPFQAPLAPIGTANNDMAFAYNVGPSGPEVVANVVYTGIGGINNIVLQIDPVDGKARIRNSSGHTVPVDGYSITSVNGSLSTAGWRSLDDQNHENWIESTSSDANQLVEFKPTSATVFTPGTSFGLGNLFMPGSTRDLEFKWNEKDVIEHVGEIVYESFTVGSADFDSDSDVDGKDFLAWQRGFGLTSGAGRLQGDATGDTAVNGADFTAWKGQFGTLSASAAMTAVPEPASGVFALIVFVAAMSRPRKSTR